MNTVGQREIITQQRVVAFFHPETKGIRLQRLTLCRPLKYV